MGSLRLWVVVAAPVALLSFLALFLPDLLGLSGALRWVLRGLIGLLAGVTGALLFVVMRRRRKRARSAAEQDEIEAAFATAEARLASSNAPTNRIDRLPALLVVGPGGSAKTTVVARSGLNPELLAGEVEREGTPVPTSTLNLWYAQGVVIVEAAGAVVEDDAAWLRVIERLEPDRLRPMLTNRPQAARGVVVCYGCDQLSQGDGGDGATAAAQALRARLHDLGRKVGARLPVYVLFTKADRIPYFADFVRNFSDEDAAEVLGASFPLDTADRATYLDAAGQAVRGSFDALTRSLALRRLDHLQREERAEAKPGIYEFPREFGKLRDRAAAFLVELCRPSQLGTAPFLRGFYFTGVRAVVVGGEPASPAGRDTAGPRSAGATMVFNPAAPRPESPIHSGGARKVPQWLFLSPVLRQVILRDDVALGATGAGEHLHVLRRAVAGVAAALLLVLSTAFTVSFTANRGLATEATEAVRAVRTAVPVRAGPVGVGELRELDRLREQAEALRAFEEGLPLRYRWGLYTGERLHAAVWRTYFTRFDQMLGGDVRGAIETFLASLPPRPDQASDYGEAYDALKAHLVMTSHAAESEPEATAAVLHRHWARGRRSDAETDELVRSQLRFYANELRHGNPFAVRPDAELVSRTRAFLLEFKDADRLYQALVAEVSGTLASVDFHALVGSAGGAVRAPHVVPGAYTEDGWLGVHDRLERIDDLLSREDWVTGGQTVSEADLEDLRRVLRERYLRDYIAHWRRYLAEASIPTFAGAGDAARKLRVLADNESPMLRLLRYAAIHTSVDTVLIAPAFQPVHVVMPPDITDRYVTEGNKPWIDAVGNLQASLEAATSAAGPARADALSQASGSIGEGKGAVRQIAQSFRVDGAAQAVGGLVRGLLDAPLGHAESLLGVLPAAEVNAKGRAFCARFADLTRGYPFNAGAATDAPLDALDGMLKPGASALWAFYEDALQPLLVRQGAEYASRVGASPRPTREFVQFFNRAATISGVFYTADGQGPALDFILEPETSAELPEVTISVDGQSQRFTRSFAAARAFRWEGARAQNATITGRIGGGPEITLVQGAPGTWSLIRLLEQADWQALGGSRYRLRWPVRGQQVTLQATLTLSAGVPILDARYLRGLRCVANVAGR